MKLTAIAEKMKTPTYDFLSNNEHLGNNVLLLTITGSWAHGTQTETSDLDIRGVAIERTREIFGLSQFEQYEDKNTDTVIFGLKKFIKLCLNANPNTLEILGSHPEHLLMATPEGTLLRENMHLFLSKKIIKSYGEYASSQLKKMTEAFAHHKEVARQNKFAMHTLRLFIAGRNLLLGRGLNVINQQEQELLRNIRGGKYSPDELPTLFSDYEKQFIEAVKQTKLPDEPDYEAVERLMISIYKNRFINIDLKKS